MAVYVNGVKISGRGISGKSPYQVAREGGYAGTEAEFNEQLSAIGESVKGFNLLSIQLNELQSKVNEAQKIANDLLVEVEESEISIKNSVTAGINNISSATNDALTTLEQAKDDAIAEFPDSSSFVAKSGSTMTGLLTLSGAPTANLHAATKKYVDDKTAAIVTDIWYRGNTAPSNTKLLWIDTTTNTGGLKFYNGSAWVHVPVAWQ